MSCQRIATGALLALGAPLALASCGAARPPVAELQADASLAAAAPESPVTVSPLPGTPDASPSTQISFLATRPMRVLYARVVGAASGVHAGVLRPYSTGTGESFLPARPFLAGEQVRVSARVRIGSLTRTASTSFAVARQVAVSENEFPLVPGDGAAATRYRSAPSLSAPRVTITTPRQPGGAPGYLMLAPYQGQATAGPMIVTQSGALVWFHPLPAGVEATDFGVQRYRGRPVLAWWQGRILELGFGVGEDVLYDSAYQQIATVRAGNGYRADLHEVRITPSGTAWIDAFDPVAADLSSVNGAQRGVLSDCVIQQIDIATGLVMWEWHALGHVPLGESLVPASRNSFPWDYVHLNSIDPRGAGDVLLSARNTSTLYDVEEHSGAIRWRLGGPRSSFTLPPGARFHWQHDAQLQPGGEISLFDNGSTPAQEKQSRGLVLAPDPSGRSVALIREFVNPARTLLAESQGSMQALSGGDWLLGYGRLPDFTEFDASGRVLLDGSLPSGVQSFKATLAQWSGRPAAPPSIAPRHSKGALSAAVSWNGATGVSRWRVLAGRSPGALAAVGTVARSGFQTVLTVPAGARYLAAQALDARGAVIGRSATVRVA